MAKVYIVGARIPTGGAYMAYHIGRLLSRHFGYDPVDVQVTEVGPALFEYDTPMPTITGGEMERAISEEDVLVVNPSFSQFLYGLRLPGRKIMYVQDFRTFLLLDCHCDLYVSVSQLVARYVHALYGINSPVIPAFITGPKQDITPWDERPENSAIIYMKNPTTEHQILLGHMRRMMAHMSPQVDLTRIIEGRGMKQEEFLTILGSVRYFVNLSLAEGFGLVPLEAMMMGAAVTGVDGLAGADYMRNGSNAQVASIRDLRRLGMTMQALFDNDELARRLVEGGRRTASHYTYEPFKNAWLAQLSTLLGKEPYYV